MQMEVRRALPLFGGAAGKADANKVRTAAVKIDSDGSVWLDIGMVSGIGPGSEFTAITTATGVDSGEIADRQGTRNRALQRNDCQSGRSERSDRRRV